MNKIIGQICLYNVVFLKLRLSAGKIKKYGIEIHTDFLNLQILVRNLYFRFGILNHIIQKSDLNHLRTNIIFVL